MKHHYPDDLKIEVLQHLEKVGSVSQAARKFSIHPSTVYGWKHIGLEAFRKRASLAQPSASQVPADPMARIRRLEQENAILREAAKLYFGYC